MPAKRKSRKLTSLKNSQKKPSLGLLIKIFLLLIVLAALPIAYYLTTQNQDVRQQAAGGCQEEDVNTEFRPFEQGTDKPWKSGNKMSSKIGDKIDVNCFAKTGSALLSNGRITLKVDGVTKTIPASSIINQGKSLRAYEITQGGVHSFTCSNNSCTDTDKITVPKPAVPQPVVCTLDAKICPDGSSVGRVAPDCNFAQCPEVDPEPTDNTCPSPSVADLNNDCSVDLKDYDLFLSEFIKGQR
jgi:hypothetical protein